MAPRVVTGVPNPWSRAHAVSMWRTTYTVHFSNVLDRNDNTVKNAQSFELVFFSVSGCRNLVNTGSTDTARICDRLNFEVKSLQPVRNRGNSSAFDSELLWQCF